jgi:hypothetical protein
MPELLDRLRSYPDVDLEELRHCPQWHQALHWGGIMASSELTGLGYAYAHDPAWRTCSDLFA